MQNVFISPATTMAHKPMGAANTPDYEVSDGELSFGVELEFLFYYRDSRLDDWQDPEALVVDDEEECALPPALVLPDDVDYIEDTYDGWTPDDENEERRGAEGSQEGEGEGGHVGEPKKTPRSWAAGLIEQAILSVPGAKLERSRTPAAQSHRSMYVMTEPGMTYSGWTVTRDGSVHDDFFSVRGYRHLAFEVTSPALWDRPQSHRHIYLVVQALIDRFRLRVNLTTGLHCHVGAGIEPAEDFNSRHAEAPEGGAQTEEAQAEGGGVQPKRVAVRMARHPLGVFKRAAALMWAADGFMAQVFPPERSLSEYAPPISFCSRLAHGIQLRYYHDSQHNLQTHERPLPPPPPTPPPSISPLPYTSLPSSHLPRLHPNHPRLPTQRTNTIPPSAQARFDTINPAKTTIHPNPTQLAGRGGGQGGRSVSIRAAVAHLLACRNHAEVAGLFEPPHGSSFYARGNYNLQSYRGEGVVDESKPAATVEFREAPGSLEPAWVATWVQVCLGFFRFARDASAERWWAVVGRLMEVEEGDGWGYDVISLLTDMGLFAEALFLERKLCGDDPLQFWYPCRLAEAPPPPLEDDLPEPTTPRWVEVTMDDCMAGWGQAQVGPLSGVSGGDDGGGDSSTASSPFVPTPTWTWGMEKPASKEVSPDIAGWEDPPDMMGLRPGRGAVR